MEAFLTSTGIVALAEMGDRTQLLTLLLAAKYRRPVPIITGIFVATILNHAMAGVVGSWLVHLFGPNVMRWLLAASFIGMAAWMMVPDKLDDAQTKLAERFGVFGTTVIAFFIAEMGDKTQIATMALAAKYPHLLPVIAGTTLGMMLANAPAVWAGDKMAKVLPLKLVHGVAALLMVVQGVLAFSQGVGQ